MTLYLLKCFQNSPGLWLLRLLAMSTLGTPLKNSTKNLSIGMISSTTNLSQPRTSSLSRILINYSPEYLISFIILKIILNSVLAKISSSYKSSYRILTFLRAKGWIRMLVGMSLAKELWTNYRHRKRKWINYAKSRNTRQNKKIRKKMTN